MPVEERVAQKLKDHFADADTPSALVAEFAKYSELLKREGLKRALRAERESLLAAYPDLIGKILLSIKILRIVNHYKYNSKKLTKN